VTKLAAVIVDTYEQNALARLAIEQTVATGLVDRVYTFSTAPIYPGEEFHRINPIHSAADYSHFMLNIVPHFVDADATLVIQWDGMPCNSEQWSDEFLRYDYIGAPWGNWDPSIAVGNGGFSLRSRKLMQVLASLKIRCDPSLPDSEAEDMVICHHYRMQMLENGCLFAPLGLAQTFSVENGKSGLCFGFHGVFNMPEKLPESCLLGHLDELCLRTGRALFLANFLLACMRRSYQDAYLECIESLRRAERLPEVAGIFALANIRLPGLA
jgi:hypothetical protein